MVINWAPVLICDLWYHHFYKLQNTAALMVWFGRISLQEPIRTFMTRCDKCSNSTCTMYVQREGPNWIFPPVVKESKHGHWCVSRLARTRIVVFLADRYCGVLRTRTVVFRCLQGHVLWWVSRPSRTRTVVGLVAFKDTYCGGSRGPQRHVLWCLIVDSRNVCSPCRFRLKLKRNFTVI